MAVEWRIPVRRGEGQAGWLICGGDGLRTSFRLDCNQAGEGRIEKLWLEGEGRFLLGTPVPTGGKLTLRRLVSNRQLEHLRPITGGVLVPVEEHPTESLTEEITDKELRELLSGSGFSLSRQGEKLVLSWPWRPGEELPVSGLFTMMEWRNGRLWLTLQKGWPKIGGG
jgi:hypothetical protein